MCDNIDSKMGVEYIYDFICSAACNEAVLKLYEYLKNLPEADIVKQNLFVGAKVGMYEVLIKSRVHVKTEGDVGKKELEWMQYGKEFACGKLEKMSKLIFESHGVKSDLDEEWIPVFLPIAGRKRMSLATNLKREKKVKRKELDEREEMNMNKIRLVNVLEMKEENEHE